MSITERAAPDITNEVVADVLVLLAAGDTEADAVTYAVVDKGRGWVDASVLASAVREARPEGERLHWQHHRDYTGHILREAAHVCRHVRGEPLYWVHEAPECSPTCQQPQHPRRHPAPAWGSCTSCGLALPATRRCDLCQ